MTYNFQVEENEAAFILQVVGNLPTQSGAFPLFQKLQAQAQAQQPAPAAEAPAETPAGE